MFLRLAVVFASWLLALFAELHYGIEPRLALGSGVAVIAGVVAGPVFTRRGVLRGALTLFAGVLVLGGLAVLAHHGHANWRDGSLGPVIRFVWMSPAIIGGMAAAGTGALAHREKATADH